MIRVNTVMTYDNGVGDLVGKPEQLEPPKEFKNKKELDAWRNELMLQRSIQDGESRTLYFIYKEIS